MNLDTAKRLMPYINEDLFNTGFQMYVDERLDALHKLLEVAGDYETVKYYQGCISELQRLSRLRVDVNAVTTLARK
jgi:hypothetical protein